MFWGTAMFYRDRVQVGKGKRKLKVGIRKLEVEKPKQRERRRRYAERRAYLSFGSPVAAGDEEGLAGDPARILGGKKDRDGADVVGLTDAAQRRLRFHRFLKVRAGDAGRMKAFRFDHARV